jgi:transcriptional regulator with XRE-family HTH domain
MAEYPGFDVLVARLAGHRGLGVRALAGRAGVSQLELRQVFDGVPPSPALLRRLAPALGLRSPDLFVIAGANVPREWAPLDELAGGEVPGLAMRMRRLPPGPRGELLAFARALPQQGRTRPLREPRAYERYEPGFGAMLLRMLAHRNLTWAGGAEALYAVSGPCLSAAALGGIGHGSMELTPDLLTAFAHVLGLDPTHLAALTDTPLPDGTPPPDRSLTDVAELIWESRRLTSTQVTELRSRLDDLPTG